MRTTLFLLHAISCCWLVGATLSKTDAKKPHKAEAEVRKFRALPWDGCELWAPSGPSTLPPFAWHVTGLGGPHPPLSCVQSWWCVTLTLFSLSLCSDFSSWVVCVGERPCCVRPALERHSEGGKETLCSYQENFSRTSAWICHTCKSDIQSHFLLTSGATFAVL